MHKLKIKQASHNVELLQKSHTTIEVVKIVKINAVTLDERKQFSHKNYDAKTWLIFFRFHCFRRRCHRKGRVLGSGARHYSWMLNALLNKMNVMFKAF